MTATALPLRHPWLLDYLACPVDFQPLTINGSTLTCGDNHVYAIFRGVPILADATTTEATLLNSLRDAHPGFVEAEGSDGKIDPFVRGYLVNTNGELYRAPSALAEYPIPSLRLPESSGETFLDIGCGWGRWSVAASRKGYRAVGVDASLDCVLAAERVAKQLGVEAAFVVGSLRQMPIRSGAIDGAVFSYSVLQHFDHDVAEAALHEMGRVAAPSATILVQLANKFGVRQLFNQLRMRFGWRRGEFEMRYWRPGQMLTVGAEVGAPRLEIDGFFSVNPQETDMAMLRGTARLVVRVSTLLRKLSRDSRLMASVADSLYLRVVNPEEPLA